ncbi:NACHT domain-containing protein [Amycolatopsis sp. NPDC004747]
MARGLCFRDAVRLLGGADNRTVAALDKLAGGALLVAAAAGVDFALGLFDPKAEFARLTGDLASGLRDRLSGLGRAERSHRLTAAHAVAVLAAFFEVLSEIELPRDLRLDRADQLRVALDSPPVARRLDRLLAAVVADDIPIPAPHRPHEAVLESLGHYYGQLATRTRDFLAGLAGWDRLDETERARLELRLAELRSRAVTRYEAHFRRLATEFPEFAFWAGLLDHQATRAAVNDLGAGLAGLERALAALAPTPPVAHPLRLAHRDALDRPMISIRDVPDGLHIPALGEAYVTPRFRVAEAGVSDQIASERWWSDRKVRADLPAFLAGHLTAPHATLAPLLVLGQPGAGKSILTQVLAARLATAEYLVVRVVLREVQVEADLQSHLEEAVRNATGEDLTWPALAREAAGALPVVLLDGFDELLQATGASQSDYLERVAEFQRREAALGRPVVVLVTSRTAVADRARPVGGMIVVRLEPFDAGQVAQWLDVWNRANEPYFTANGLCPLTAEVVAPHADLAGQPLMLFMLALYDADDNSLQHHDVALGQAELYEQLLGRFAAREVLKSGGGLTAAGFHQATEQELLRLSVAAFAMFNRTRQWVTEAELDADLAALLTAPQRPTAELRATLTAAQLMFGRFYFIHETQAVQDDRRLRTYEFLHATFGEYLVGRLVTEELRDLTAAARAMGHRGRPGVLDDSFLHALLSFAPLVMRETTVSFIGERLATVAETDRAVLRELLLSLARQALQARHTDAFAGYRPRPATQPERHAAYSVNLTILLVLVSGRLSVDELFPDAAEPVDAWRRLTLLWRSQLPGEGWKALIHRFTVERAWQGERRTAFVVPSEAASPGWEPDTYWTYGRYWPGHPTRPVEPYQRLGWYEGTFGYLRNQGRFQCEADDDVVVHALDPFHPGLSAAVFTFHHGGVLPRPVSGAHALIALWLAATSPGDAETVTWAFTVAWEFAAHGFAPSDADQRHRYRVQVLNLLVLIADRFPVDWFTRLRSELRELAAAEAHENDTLLAGLLDGLGLAEPRAFD